MKLTSTPPQGGGQPLENRDEVNQVGHGPGAVPRVSSSASVSGSTEARVQRATYMNSRLSRRAVLTMGSLTESVLVPNTMVNMLFREHRPAYGCGLTSFFPPPLASRRATIMSVASRSRTWLY